MTQEKSNMAETSRDHVSNSDDEVMEVFLPDPPPKRRRTLYTNKVTRSQKKKLAALKQVDSTANEDIVQLWTPSLLKSKNKPFNIDLSNSEEKRQSHQTHSAKPMPRKRAHKISLKCHWRLDVHEISVLSTDPLSKVLAQLSGKLKVPPSKILLMKNDIELPVHSSITQLDLSTADIIDCVVLTDDKEDESSCDVITVRLQGKEKGSTHEYSLNKNTPLGSVLSQYTVGLSAAAKRKVKFLFDGLKVMHSQTPSQLDMDDGDVIDVWN